MKIYREITPLSNDDVYVVLDSVNQGFDYPLHHHMEYEINLVVGASGKRIVGDSTEKYLDQDLVLLGPYLFHKWDDSLKAGTEERPCRVITIQFDMHLFDSVLLLRNPFHHIRELFLSSYRGIRYTGESFDKAKQLMIRMTEAKGGIRGVSLFFELLDLLAKSKDRSFLTSEGFEPKTLESSGTRLQAAYQYMIKHFTRPDLNIVEVANVVHLSPSAFSHFFRKCTMKSFRRFIIDMRLGYTCKLLINTDYTISQICTKAGFNNTANFNRIFKKYHQCTPYAFRKRYQGMDHFDWMEQLTPGQFLPVDADMKFVLKPDTYSTRILHR
jgi:AraC-like DNA-binding protein